MALTSRSQFMSRSDSPDMLIGVNLARTAKLELKFSQNRFCNSLIAQQVPDTHVTHFLEFVSLNTNRTFIQTVAIIDLMERFHSVFAQDCLDFGRIPGFQHEIRMGPNAQPFHKQPFRLSAAKEEIIRKLVQDLVKAGICRPSQSPFACAAFLVPKHSGEWRLVIDFQPLNHIVISQRNLPPIIRDLIDQLVGSSNFSNLDIAWGYWHVVLTPESCEKTSFVTPFGQFEFSTSDETQICDFSLPASHARDTSRFHWSWR